MIEFQVTPNEDGTYRVEVDYSLYNSNATLGEVSAIITDRLIRAKEDK